jgi:hypothetical protein
MPQRERPAPKNRPSRDATSANQLTQHRRQDGYAAPTAQDRAEQRVLKLAAEHGFTLAVRCMDCGHFVVSEESVRAHRGPRCRARAGVPA